MNNELEVFNGKLERLKREIKELSDWAKIFFKSNPELSTTRLQRSQYNNETFQRNRGIKEVVIELLEEKSLWMSLKQLKRLVEFQYPGLIPSHLIHTDSYFKRTIDQMVRLGDLKITTIDSISHKLVGLPDWNENEIISHGRYLFI